MASFSGSSQEKCSSSHSVGLFIFLSLLRTIVHIQPSSAKRSHDLSVYIPASGSWKTHPALKKLPLTGIIHSEVCSEVTQRAASSFLRCWQEKQQFLERSEVDCSSKLTSRDGASIYTLQWTHTCSNSRVSAGNCRAAFSCDARQHVDVTTSWLLVTHDFIGPVDVTC